jgi:hypothetical protein
MFHDLSIKKKRTMHLKMKVCKHSQATNEPQLRFESIGGMNNAQEKLGVVMNATYKRNTKSICILMQNKSFDQADTFVSSCPTAVGVSASIGSPFAWQDKRSTFN